MNRDITNAGTVKKPIFKRWWFWVIIIVVVIIGISATVNKDNEATKIGDNGSQQEQQQTEFKVGDVIAYDSKEITVKSVERNYKPSSEFAIPKEGMEYIKVDLYIENKSDDRISYNAFDWEIQDTDGNIENYSDAMFAQANDALGSGELAKGGKKSGSVVFEVPKDSVGLTLHYKASFWSDKTIEIKI
jgi:hypothetical protein